MFVSYITPSSNLVCLFAVDAIKYLLSSCTAIKVLELSPENIGETKL